MNPYRITFKVRPTPKHPAYWDIQFGYLHFILWDDDGTNAAVRGMAIFLQLPFEQIGPKIAVYDESQTTAEECQARGWPWLVDKFIESQKFGFTYFFEAWEVGMEESDFVKSNFPFAPDIEV